MAETNFLIFNEENNPDRTYNDSEYKNATQRLTGVIPGMALSRQHNKMYFQWSAMCKAIADFLVTSGYNCMDNNVEGITEGLTKTVTDMIKKDLSTHNTDNETHKTLFDKKLDTTGGTLTGDLNASGYNITATKFIGNLQGKADNAANADLAAKATTAENANNAANATHATSADSASIATSADSASIATKATQDSQGQAINTTYIKSITASNATLTVTKGNGTTSAVTINNVAHSTDADNAGKLNNKGDISASTLPNNFTTGLTTHSAYNGNYPSQYGNVININNKGKSQIFMEWKGDDNAAGAPGGIWYRECRDNQNVWSNWAKIAYLTDCTDTLKKVYPVGSIYMSTVSTNPATLFGFGTWEAMPAGRVLLAQGKSSWGTTYNAGSTGGEATHQLTVGELPSHNHTATISTTNLTGWFTNNGNSDTANGDGTIFKASKRTSQGSSSGGAADGGKFTFNGTHAHTIAISNIGSNQPHNNIQPYIAVYIWKRVN